MKPVALITVIYNNYTVLDDLFTSLKKQTDTAYHVYIADASSEKQTIVTNIPHTVIPIENKGYAHGVNVALDHAIKDGSIHFCVINDDIYFEKDFISSVHTAVKKYPKSLIGGKIYYASGYEYHSSRYNKRENGKVLWYAGGTVDWNHATTHHTGVDEVDDGQYNKLVTTGFITGCLMCFDKEVVDAIGLWDESYFLYYEDADYCERAKKNNIPLMYVPHITIWHKNAQSTDGSGSKLHERYQKDARFKFGMKYAPLRTRLHLLKNRIL